MPREGEAYRLGATPMAIKESSPTITAAVDQQSIHAPHLLGSDQGNRIKTPESWTFPIKA